MYTKRALFQRANSALLYPSSSSESAKRIHKFLRNLSTAAERLDFRNSNEYRTEDSSNFSGDINPRPYFKGSKEYWENQNRSGSCNEVSESVLQTQSQSLSSNSWQQNLSVSNPQVQSQNQENLWKNLSYGTNSDYRNGGSSWYSGNNNKTFNSKKEYTIEGFDAFCKQDNLKLALDAMNSLEKKGHFLDLARLLRLAQLCGEEDGFHDADTLQETKVSVQGKIRALVYHLDANYLKTHTDLVVEEFDAFYRKGNVKKALYAMDTLESLSHVLDLDRLLRLAKLCGEAEASREAKAVHWKIRASVSHLDVSSYQILIEMYSNCGLVNEASSVFEEMPEKNLETWCSIIRCFAKNGLGEDAIDMFTRFKNEGNKPDGRLFRGVFYTCGLLGDIDEGLLHFMSMSKDYGIIPTMDDYVSIVEMFALPGFLDEALEFVERMPMEPNADVWETLMNLSRVHGDLELGDRCAEIVEELDPTRLNKQSKEGFLPVKASDVEKESLKKRSGIHSFPSFTPGVRQEFKAGDTNLPENDELFELLRSLKMHMVEMGYVPLTKIALHDVDDESKESALLGHSERIAFARGVLNSAPRKTFTVLKNLRVCIDCHNALKIMAVIVGREVIMRDIKRFHHMKDGACTCGDYW
ncbi:hypothetical protein EUTSA_v10000083mg [Eutrema salsugineum]|uniref:DYW domain-containing protein n=1 Tax=Eutrema salsugineum TaxID=72664 RepID=V4M303_EUTSA|nr:pentatricopeptide repeat-containing protein At2g25580 [Eutrema salsugineum]ESQ46608.1 hypothetical protein EUTSA_v10000083mg [Eutrema salsugineum]